MKVDAQILPSNLFTHYISSAFDIPEAGFKHVYTIELHKCKYNAEVAALLEKYERAVHKREKIDENFA